VFDEPSGSLDNTFRNLFLQLLLEKFQTFPFTTLFITHDYSIISEIYNRYKPLLDHIVFKELSRSDGRLILQDFAPQAYLDWLNAEKKKPFSGRRSQRQKTVLKISGGYEVFGKRMVISRDGSRKEYGELTIDAGEMVYVKAASGAGKTTLAKIIMGLRECRRLQLSIFGQHFTEETPKNAWQKYVWGKTIGMVFQHADEALNLNATVKEVFGGLPLGEKITPLFIKERLRELFDFEITEEFLNKKVSLLSGGQKQRLNLLRTLALETDLIIFDEPLNGLDFLSIKKVIGMIQERQQQGKAILMISHNEEIFDAIVPPESIYYLFGN
jgi:ABC-type dipeptide/oligopeptide/nickel transport system ATPase subunit